MDNKELKNLYEKVYIQGKDKFFTFSTADVTREVLSELDWSDRRVLEIGCGTGETAYLIALTGAAHVRAIDYAESAIQESKRRHQHPNLVFEVRSFENVDGEWDVIIMQEVIEHLDDPAACLAKLKNHLSPEGSLLVTCPSFLNVRGYVWMTLQLLLNVPMSLTDRQFITPWQMESWASDLDLEIRWRTFRHRQAHGDQMIVDLKKRLTNALHDAGLSNNRVEDLLSWLEKACLYQSDEYYNGAKALYLLKPNHMRNPGTPQTRRES